MASQIVDNRPVEVLTDPQEVAFIKAWRAADDEGKRYLDKVLRAASLGLLPSVEAIKDMSTAERRALIDSLPLEEA